MNSRKGSLSINVIMTGIVRMIEYIIAVFVLFAIVSMLISSKVSVGKTEGDVFISRIIYSAAAREDAETGRTYPGIIDMEKLEKSKLEKSMKGNLKAGVKIRAGSKEAIYNERYYNYLLPLAESNIPGKSGTLSKKEANLLTYDNGREELQRIKFESVTPK